MSLSGGMIGFVSVGGLSTEPTVLSSRRTSNCYSWIGEMREARGDLLAAMGLSNFTSAVEPLSHSATELCALLTFFLELLNALSAGLTVPYGSPRYGSLTAMLAVLTDSILLFTGSHGLACLPIEIVLLFAAFLAR